MPQPAADDKRPGRARRHRHQHQHHQHHATTRPRDQDDHARPPFPPARIFAKIENLETARFYPLADDER